ncbi:hypothetical protein, partial [Clavibacter michiganensis]|uniref:hypothetical protein n=1 Tax=Clavibacter michiganensis TaxID=28447 RepID=UPI00292F7231
IGTLIESHACGEDIKGESSAWIGSGGAESARVQVFFLTAHIRRVRGPRLVHDDHILNSPRAIPMTS